jgi:hypothetical protein
MIPDEESSIADLVIVDFKNARENAPYMTGWREPKSTLSADTSNRRPEVGRRIVPELEGQRVGFEGRLDDAPLDAASAPMHQPDLGEPGVRRRGHEFLDHRPDVARREGVEIDLALDRDFEARNEFLILNNEFLIPNS